MNVPRCNRCGEAHWNFVKCEPAREVEKIDSGPVQWGESMSGFRAWGDSLESFTNMSGTLMRKEQ